AGDTLRADEICDQVRRVAGERGRDHRDTGKLPRYRTAGGEELRRALAGAFSKEQRRQEADRDAEDRDDPIEGMELHVNYECTAPAPGSASMMWEGSPA